MAVHRRVGVEVYDPEFGRGALQPLEMCRRMHPLELLEGGQWRVVIREVGIQALRDQVIADGTQALGCLGMVRTHVVQMAIAMGDESRDTHCNLSVATGTPPAAPRPAMERVED